MARLDNRRVRLNDPVFRRDHAGENGDAQRGRRRERIDRRGGQARRHYRPVGRGGAKISVAGRNQRDAGAVELSAGGTATIGAVKIDLSAAAGAAGTLLIDPTDLVIGTVDPTAPVDASYAANFMTFGGNVDLTATRSITVARDGVIDTTLSGGQSGAIDLSAPSISLLGGSQLLAGATGRAARRAPFRSPPPRHRIPGFDSDRRDWASRRHHGRRRDHDDRRFGAGAVAEPRHDRHSIVPHRRGDDF